MGINKVDWDYYVDYESDESKIIVILCALNAGIKYKNTRCIGVNRRLKSALISRLN